MTFVAVLRKIFLLMCLCSVSVAGLFADDVAQRPETSPAPNEVFTVERVENLLHEAEHDATLATEARAAIIEIYRASLADLKSSNDLKARLATLTADAETATGRAEKIRLKLEELKTKPPSIDEHLSLAELEQQLTQLELQLATQKQSRTVAESESQSRSQRRKEIRARLISIPQRIDAAKVQGLTLAASDPTSLSTARDSAGCSTVAARVRVAGVGSRTGEV